MSHEKEWWELVNPYLHGVVPPSLETIDDFVRAITSGDKGVINVALWEARQNASTLKAVFEALAIAPSPSLAVKQAFQSAWVTQGLRLREAFAIDPILPGLLANLLPGYDGPAVEIYRGERTSNYQLGAYGPSWSSKKSVAECFARGLNKCPKTGGVVLRTVAQPSAILADLTIASHRSDEAEYVVDRRGLENVEAVEFYAPD